MSQSTPSASTEVYACVGFCDPPIQELMRWMRLLPVGSVVAVDSCDVSDTHDIPTWLDLARYEFIGATLESDYTRYVARKTH